ncbi:MAG TPA: phosphatidate cytidylyltransferase [Solirubrobacterales bacterium]|jgi:phosphatidate cytidylyltransferase|nr:phosphatidate cytidylyltransferase [Solirubrobacterales bacterium]HMU26568.1 phosphatidate cytidylyltransferase [Solirubrobacterales bacterium]HMX70614.1 phosphatidate cytidylyltransferase [Solirubrobacterales bacterium]HMY26898.1 phosphatidate cytidylyltransferase [Solirubrobacterales bacterium]HNA22875.1 phosphatidate cytidylyltransferase [Solirubrobacterales bacterium]
MGETAKRILVAVPWIIVVIAIIVLGGPWFAAALAVFGCLGLREFFQMAEEYRPFRIPAYLSLVGIVASAWLGTQFNVLMFLALPFLLIFFGAARRKDRTGVTGSVAATLLGIYWIGLALAHAVLLRELPDHGGALVVDVLVGTFACDTGAYAVGRMFGSHKFAPNLSPNKTIEGLIGGFLIGMLGVWCAGLYQDWLSGVDALILGAAVAAVAPVGDLFESMIKRDLGTKDTGNLFGPHGGLLDRLDAVFFTIVVGYYVSVALVY